MLIGLILNAAFGWWRAHPLAGFVIVGNGVKDGLASWRAGAYRIRGSGARAMIATAALFVSLGFPTSLISHVIA